MKTNPSFFKRITGLALAASLLMGLVSGCSSAAIPDAGGMAASTQGSGETDSLQAADGTLDPANPTTITFYSYSLAYPTMKPGIEHLINEFNETTGKEVGSL